MNNTKGEWKVRIERHHKASGGRIYNIEIRSPMNSGRGHQPICKIYHGYVNDEANAQLIASAPDLYEALKLTRNNLQTLSDAALHYKKTFSANLEILNKALSKAEGK